MEPIFAKLNVILTFEQVLNIVKKFSRRKKLQLLYFLQDDLEKIEQNSLSEEAKNPVDVNTPKGEESNPYDKPLVTHKMLQQWEDEEINDEDEPEMTDEEFYKAVQEMS